MTHIAPVLDQILGLVTERADACLMPGWCRTGLVPGAAAWDVCCDCGDGVGQLWARLIDMQPDPEFTQPGPTGCDQPIRLTIGVGSLRCVPKLDEQGFPPSASAEQAATELILWDAELIKDAVMCGLEERFWLSWTALDNSGGCGGGEHIFQVPFYGCRCDDCDDPEESPGGGESS